MAIIREPAPHAKAAYAGERLLHLAPQIHSLAFEAHIRERVVCMIMAVIVIAVMVMTMSIAVQMVPMRMAIFQARAQPCMLLQPPTPCLFPLFR